MAKDYKVKILKSGEKRYVFDIDLGYSVDGKRLRTTINSKTIKEGRKKKAELLLGKKNIVQNNSLLFDEAWNLYITDCQKRGMDTYIKQKKFEKHYSYFKNSKIKKIKESDMNLFIENLSIDLKSNTKHNIITDLKTFFNWCEKKKIIDDNIFKYVDIPKKQKNEINFWTEDEFKKFIRTVDNDYWNLIFTTLFYTGLRKGELFGLSYEDIHGYELHLSHTIRRENAKQVLSDSFKTSTSKRIVPIPKWLNLGKGEGLIFNRGYNCAGHVLSDFIIKYNNTHEDKLKPLRIHDFRHSYISMLIYKKVDIFTISKVVGHTDIKITTQTYGHLYDKMREEISDIL